MTGETFDRKLLWLAVVPALSYVIVYFILDRLRPLPVPFDIVPSAEFASKAADESQRRYIWLSAFALLTVVSIGVSVSGALSLWRETLRRDRTWVFGLLGFVSVVVLIASVVPGLGVPWQSYMGADLYKQIFAKVHAGDGWTAYDLFLIGKKLIKGSTILALAVLAICLILTLKRPPARLPRVTQAKLTAVAIARQRVYLNQAALVYVFAVLAMLSWMYWPLPYLTPDSAEAYRKVLSGAAGLQGLGFTLGVALVYLPPAFILRNRAEKLATEILVLGGDEKNVAADIGPLAAHPFDHLRQVMTMVLPVIVSLLPALYDASKVLTK